jgi:thiamine pyrophosphate-dependent acetolactate synthase large subunit-like protein
MSDVASKPVAVATAGENGKSTKVRAYTLFARALKRQGVDTVFFVMGGPMVEAHNASHEEGIRMIDVRHEQAAAMAAQAYARVRAQPGVCSACSGPGTINLSTGIANALIDCVPVVALGGSSPVGQYGKGAFQEIDQVAIMRPMTKWAERVYEAKRIPELIERAFHEATSGKPGPVYLDFPGDILYEWVEEADIQWGGKPPQEREVERTAATPHALERFKKMLGAAKKPIIFSGGGILFSQASNELKKFVDATGIPFYTTPQGRGVIAEDHDYFYGSARTTAMKESDLVIVLGTRLNYVMAFGKPPRFNPDAKWIRVDVDPVEINNSPQLDLGIVGDAKAVLEQLNAALAGKVSGDAYAAWRSQLEKIEQDRRPKEDARLNTDQTPIHPLRLCKEVRDFIDRDAILCVDGQEILNYGRQSIPTYVAGHRLNSGPFGTMGVGMPFGLGAKAARPDKQVIVLHGDGSFGMNAMELDTVIRHKLPVIVIISLNGGWTADPTGEKIGSRLGYTRFDKMAEGLGCHGEFVERPEDIRPALDRAKAAVAKGQTALVNVVTDSAAKFAGFRHANYRT